MDEDDFKKFDEDLTTAFYWTMVVAIIIMVYSIVANMGY